MVILCTPDEKPIGILGNIVNLKTNIYFNEMSYITFEISDIYNGTKSQFYDDIIGMRQVDLRINDNALGRFVLVNPEEVNDGVHRTKSCKAYSLEYEMTYKKISIAEGTYNLWNPVTPESTILGIILSYLPAWSIGEVDEALIGKYRTFSIDNENIYNFIKNTLQKTYQCIFDFDTYNRKIHIRSSTDNVSSVPVFLSQSNLVKEIKLVEDTESILTVLDVNGADGVSIRSVNPMGSNKIYNLDYFMTPSHFPAEMIEKWNNWRTAYNAAQTQYYNTSVQRVILTQEILLKESKIAELREVSLASLENERSVYIQYIASLSNTASDEYQHYQSLLSETNTEIRNKEAEIATLTEELSTMKSEKDTLTGQLQQIIAETSHSAFFTKDELLILNRYFKEDAISDSNFVYTEVDNYSGSDIHSGFDKLLIQYSADDESNYNTTEIDDGRTIVTVKSGLLTLFAEEQSTELLSAEMVRGDIEYRTDNTFVLTAYLGSGTIRDTDFPSGCITVSGTCYSRDNHSTESLNCNMYFTQNTTEYQRYAVEWELYEYGVACLEKLAFPSYTFDISSANFFLLDAFVDFVRRLGLGKKIYLALTEDTVIEPILIGFSVSYDDPSSLDLIFSDTYNLSDNALSLVDLLDQSVSMGKSLDASRFSYNAFLDSGAATSVKKYMDSALDVSKQAILSGGNMAVSWDASGIKCRKYTEDQSGYEPEQIAIINNSIVFTDDDWKPQKWQSGASMTRISERYGVLLLQTLPAPCLPERILLLRVQRKTVVSPYLRWMQMGLHFIMPNLISITELHILFSILLLDLVLVIILLLPRKMDLLYGTSQERSSGWTRTEMCASEVLLRRRIS